MNTMCTATKGRDIIDKQTMGCFDLSATIKLTGGIFTGNLVAEWLACWTQVQ